MSQSHAYQKVAAVSLHVFLHEVEDSEPQRCEGRQAEQGTQVLQEHLKTQRKFGCALS